MPGAPAGSKDGVHTFVVLKTMSCPYCQQALGFLKELAKQRGDIRVGTVDANGQPHEARQIQAHTRWSTVPQIFLDGRFVGGWNELAQAAKSGRLDAFLEGKEWEEPVKKERKGLRALWPFGRRGPAHADEGTDI